MGRRLETSTCGVKGDPGMEPMRRREATGTSPEGRNAGEDGRWPGMEMGEVRGLREQVPSSAGIQEFPWSPLHVSQTSPGWAVP